MEEVMAEIFSSLIQAKIHRSKKLNKSEEYEI
jgi:hypothetical protein